MRITSLDDFIYETAAATGQAPTRLFMNHNAIADIQTEILELDDAGVISVGFAGVDHKSDFEPGWVMTYKGIPIYRDPSLPDGQVRSAR